jgi:hypothetical protein
MPYRAELDYLIRVMKKLHLQSVLIPAHSAPPPRLDMGLRKLLGLESDYARTFQRPSNWAKPNTIYKMTDSFRCTYLLLLLPDQSDPEALLIGPFLSAEKTREHLMEEADPDRLSLLNVADVLVDGPFVENLKSYEALYRGSTNQRLIDLNQTRKTGKLVLWTRPDTLAHFTRPSS